MVALPERFPARSKASTASLCDVPQARFDAVPEVVVGVATSLPSR